MWILWWWVGAWITLFIAHGVFVALNCLFITLFQRFVHHSTMLENSDSIYPLYEKACRISGGATDW